MSVVRFRHDRQQIIIPVAVLPLATDAAPLRMVRLRALIDTGASLCGISAAAIQELKLPRGGKIAVVTPAGDHMARTYRFRLGLFPAPDMSLPHVMTSDFMAIESHAGSKFDMLIGMNVLGSGDLRVDRDGTGAFHF